MKKVCSKDELLESIGALEKYISEVEKFLKENRGKEVPEDFKEEYSDMIEEYRMSVEQKFEFEAALLFYYNIIA